MGTPVEWKVGNKALGNRNHYRHLYWVRGNKTWCISWENGLKQMVWIEFIWLVISYWGGHFSLYGNCIFKIWFILLVLSKQSVCQIHGQSAFQAGSALHTLPSTNCTYMPSSRREGLWPQAHLGRPKKGPRAVNTDIHFWFEDAPELIKTRLKSAEKH